MVTAGGTNTAKNADHRDQNCGKKVGLKLKKCVNYKDQNSNLLFYLFRVFRVNYNFGPSGCPEIAHLVILLKSHADGPCGVQNLALLVPWLGKMTKIPFLYSFSFSFNLLIIKLIKKNKQKLGTAIED